VKEEKWRRWFAIPTELSCISVSANLLNIGEDVSSEKRKSDDQD
jgi:hypothetical protein